MFCLCADRTTTPDEQKEPAIPNNEQNSVSTTQPMLKAKGDLMHGTTMASTNMSHSQHCIRQRTVSQLKLETKRKSSKSKPYIEKSSPIEEDIEEEFLRNAFSDDEEEDDGEEDVFLNVGSLMKSSPAALLVKMKYQQENKASIESGVPTKVEVANWVQQQLMYSPPQRKRTT